MNLFNAEVDQNFAMRTVHVFRTAVGNLTHLDVSCKRLLPVFSRRPQIINMLSTLRCTASANVTDAWNLPLHYLDGKRVQPMNSNRSNDIAINEPATGKYTGFKCQQG